jgi:hypothetical protein
MTTHSPYIINFLSIAIQADILKNKIVNSQNKQKLIQKIEEIIPLNAVVASGDVAIYQLDDTGQILRLPAECNIPSDNNYLNNTLKEGNDIFDALLEIEESI